MTSIDSKQSLLFTPAMIRAMVAGHKTQTRRINKGPCPYKKGSDIWVRETWGVEPRFNKTRIRDLPEDVRIVFRSEYPNDDPFDEPIIWRPSIYMPKRKCRFLLDVREAHTEELNEISYEDAKAEGADVFLPTEAWLTEPDLVNAMRKFRLRDVSMMVAKFAYLWDSINGKRKGCSWDENTRVDVIKFKLKEVQG